MLYEKNKKIDDWADDTKKYLENYCINIEITIWTQYLYNNQLIFLVI